MPPEGWKVALIVGARDGLSASLTRKLTAAGVKAALAARDTDKLAGLLSETAASAFECDATKPDDVARLFQDIGAQVGAPDVVVYKASGWLPGPVAELDPAEVQRVMAATALGGFLVGQQAARVMEARGSGVILFTGATASLKGSVLFALVAMGKFALRGLAQSMARELEPEGVHVAHVVVDGGIRSPGPPMRRSSRIAPWIPTPSKTPICI